MGAKTTKMKKNMNSNRNEEDEGDTISREARLGNETADIYAGKGSGAIENASRKVIGINGKQDSTDKTVSLFKNSDGDLFDVELMWTPSFRLKRRI